MYQMIYRRKDMMKLFQNKGIPQMSKQTLRKGRYLLLLNIVEL